jgi:predicted nucleic acid-binding protein
LILDTSGLFAALDSSSRFHVEARASLLSAPDRAILSPFVLAELDYFVAERLGSAAELALLEQVGSGAYELAPFANADVEAARGVVAQYEELGIGLADASVVVLAARHGTQRVLTLDERHFRALRPLEGGHFVLLPADG